MSRIIESEATCWCATCHRAFGSAGELHLHEHVCETRHAGDIGAPLGFGRQHLPRLPGLK